MGDLTSTESDAALVVRAQHGDPEAFGRLVERYMRRAYMQALGLVGSREDALDLSQEAFVRAYRARHTIDPDRPFYAWLYRIIRHLCFNFLRDTKARARVLEAEGTAWLVERARAASPGPAAALEQAEARRRVAHATDEAGPGGRPRWLAPRRATPACSGSHGDAEARSPTHLRSGETPADQRPTPPGSRA
jgi:RNA polymerase sigma factor (sigma-70 family)